MTKILLPLIKNGNIEKFTIQLGQVCDNGLYEKFSTGSIVTTVVENGKAELKTISEYNLGYIIKSNIENKVDTTIDTYIREQEQKRALRSCIPTATLPLFDEVLGMYSKLAKWEVNVNSKEKELLSLYKLYCDIAALDEYIELVSNLQTERGKKIASSDRQRMLSRLNKYGLILANAKLLSNAIVTNVETISLRQYEQSVALLASEPVDVSTAKSYLGLAQENTRMWSKVQPSVEYTFPETVGKFLAKTYKPKD